jgi:histidinol-phosphate aminotransferase
MPRMIKKNTFRQEILSDDLIRPNWIKQNSRSLDKLWLDKNECINPEMNSIVLECLLTVSAETVFTYPNLGLLYKKISQFDKVLPENILLTEGSDGAIRACFESCTVPGDKIVLTRPTFAMYDVYAKIYGVDITWLNYSASPNGPVLEAERIVNIIRKIKPKMVCLPNPDSPTGTIFSPEDLRSIVDAADKVNALMLIDEAYHPLYQWTAVPWINEYKHLVVVRSFSKAWGAAGLRVGYAIANKELMLLLHKQKPMYEIGNVSAKVVEALLDYEKDMRLSVEKINAGKRYFQDSMRKIGLLTYKSYGNFVHVKFGNFSNQIHNALENRVYYRKDFNAPCLEGYSRFSTTTKDQFKPIVSCIADMVNYDKNSSCNENL